MLPLFHFNFRTAVFPPQFAALQQRPLKVFKQKPAADIGTFWQEEHGHLVFNPRVGDQIGIIAVDVVESIIHRIQTQTSRYVLPIFDHL